MIGKLTGIITRTSCDKLLIDVGGVGYVVFCSQLTITKLPQDRELVSILIEMQVKENDIKLYGFLEEKERQCFNYLQSVQNIGGRVALTILSVLDVCSVVFAVKNQDTSAFQKVSGIGEKLANRIITELSRNKGLMSLASNIGEEGSQDWRITKNVEIIEDAVSAVTKLGLNRGKALGVAEKLYAQDSQIALQELIKGILSSFGG